MSTRYALYFAPPADSQLARFGEIVLGRTATQARSPEVTCPHPPFRDRWLTLTKSPAHYGFHATLKAPFELARQHSIDKLRARVEEYASQKKAVLLPGLQPRFLAGFAALTLENQPKTLSQLALQIVETFEPFRRPLSADDIQRRKQQALSARQLELLDQYGYPYVDEEFRFHMTLTGAITDQDQDYIDWLQDTYQQLVDETPRLDQLAIYSQTNRTAPFVRLDSFPLATD